VTVENRLVNETESSCHSLLAGLNDILCVAFKTMFYHCRAEQKPFGYVVHPIMPSVRFSSVFLFVLLFVVKKLTISHIF